MFEQDKYLTTLRKAYKKSLALHLSAVIMSLLFVGYMLVGEVITIPLIGCIAAGVGAVVAIAGYAIERALYRKGKNAFWVMIPCIIVPPFSFLIIGGGIGLSGINTVSVTPYFAAFILFRAVIPLIQLLRDGARLREGDPCETVGAVKKNTRRVEGGRTGESYLLFEDELTHETHLLRVSHLSPAHRYRVFYLPHSGLAAGEVIPDDVTFDPFGNPIEREVTEEGEAKKAPYREDEGYAEKPDYDENGGYAEKPAYDEDGGYAVKPDYTEVESDTAQASYAEAYAPTEDNVSPYRDSRYAPNSPDRQKAARYAVAGKVCKVLTFICFGLVFVGAISAKVTAASPLIILFFIPLIVVALLNSYFKHKELKLRCTERAIAFCIDTVRRSSGKSSTRHPIVEYQVDGVRHTAELSISCTRGAVGETYTIYYDPLDPDTVRAE